MELKRNPFFSFFLSIVMVCLDLIGKKKGRGDVNIVTSMLAFVTEKPWQIGSGRLE